MILLLLFYPNQHNMTRRHTRFAALCFYLFSCIFPHCVAARVSKSHNPTHLSLFLDECRSSSSVVDVVIPSNICVAFPGNKSIYIEDSDGNKIKKRVLWIRGSTCSGAILAEYIETSDGACVLPTTSAKKEGASFPFFLDVLAGINNSRPSLKYSKDVFIAPQNNKIKITEEAYTDPACSDKIGEYNLPLWSPDAQRERTSVYWHSPKGCSGHFLILIGVDSGPLENQTGIVVDANMECIQIGDYFYRHRCKTEKNHIDKNPEDSLDDHGPLYIFDIFSYKTKNSSSSNSLTENNKGRLYHSAHAIAESSRSNPLVGVLVVFIVVFSITLLVMIYRRLHCITFVSSSSSKLSEKHKV